MAINKLLAREWEAAGYPPGMASAWVTRPPANHLIRAYHFTTQTFAINNIEHGRLKISRFSDANDPFELLALAVSNHATRKAIRQFKEELDDEMGLLCFSANWNSPPLWSHYADKHRGICLGFDIPRDKAVTVSYEESRLQSQANRIIERRQIDEALQEFLIGTKFTDWSYEREIRIKVMLKDAIAQSGLFFWPFGNDIALAEVILGRYQK